MKAIVAIVLFLCVSSAAAQWTKTRKKTEGVSCRVPINQLACRLDPNGNVQSVFYGGWGSNPDFAEAAAAGHIDYLQGPDGYWYTQNWCSSWGFLQRCSSTISPTPREAEINAVVATPPFPDNSYDAGSNTQTIEYVTGMRVCYTAAKKSSPIARIEWDTQKYEATWVEDPTFENPPMSQVTAVDGTERVVSCGDANANCLFEEEWVAPDGEVLGGIYAKCKYSQGWGKWWLTGAYKPRYYLKSIHKACSTVPTPYPSGKFKLCEDCVGGDPNVDTCSDFARYQCPSAC